MRRKTKAETPPPVEPCFRCKAQDGRWALLCYWKDCREFRLCVDCIRDIAGEWREQQEKEPIKVELERKVGR